LIIFVRRFWIQRRFKGHDQNSFFGFYLEIKASKTLINPQLRTSNPYNGVTTRYVARVFAAEFYSMSMLRKETRASAKPSESSWAGHLRPPTTASRPPRICLLCK
jgi:hypothetical protein